VSGPVATMSESERLARLLDLLLPNLSRAGRRLVDHPQVRELYPEYLIRMHWVVRASVPLMEAARTRAALTSANDPTAAAVGAYLEEHIEEELRHDEWLLEDLEALGWSRTTVLDRVPSPAVAGVVGAQYYWMFHYHPVALLGYTMLLEGYPPGPADVELLMAKTGYGADAFRTMRGHAELDPGHAEELFATIDALSLTPGQSTVLGLSAMSTAHGLARVLDELVDVAVAPV
jgi:pyrroloquinoline quinone (PQQ) biosynthesis protein C